MKLTSHANVHARNELHGNSQAAFTLVELLTVVAIMGVLAGMIIGVSGYVWRAAQEAKARANIEHIQSALNEYMMQSGTYPPPDSTAYPQPEELLNKAGATTVSNYLSPWLKEGPNFVDPWGQGYRYQKTGKMTYKLYSTGKDKKPFATGLPEDDIYAGR